MSPHRAGAFDRSANAFCRRRASVLGLRIPLVIAFCLAFRAEIDHDLGVDQTCGTTHASCHDRILGPHPRHLRSAIEDGTCYPYVGFDVTDLSRRLPKFLQAIGATQVRGSALFGESRVTSPTGIVMGVRSAGERSSGALRSSGPV